MSFLDKLSEKMQSCAKVKEVADVLNAMVRDGLGDKMLGMYLGRTENFEVTLPVVDIMFEKDGSAAFFSPIQPKFLKDKKVIPSFDLLISFDDDSMTIKLGKSEGVNTCTVE
jgi:hypothetical protein